jgi:mannose-6-phosphate isomerase-like protein (cupin superfamily)
MDRPKTIFCDIDGTLVKHKGDTVLNVLEPSDILQNVQECIKEWERLNYCIVLTTGRKESTRARTEEQLAALGIVYDHLVMGLPNGERILINDKKPEGIENTARAINVVRNSGLVNISLTTPGLTPGSKIDKPWGYEELVEYNANYVVKKLFMKKGHSCSLQYHELKTETIVILKGSLNIYIDSTKKEYHEGESVTIRPYTHHRMEGLEDCLYLEASTNELWDVVRLQDNYGRA